MGHPNHSKPFIISPFTSQVCVVETSIFISLGIFLLARFARMRCCKLPSWHRLRHRRLALGHLRWPLVAEFNGNWAWSNIYLWFVGFSPQRIGDYITYIYIYYLLFIYLFVCLFIYLLIGWFIIYLFVCLFVYLFIIEGSLEVKLTTIWTDEKQSREEAERRERLEERRVEEKE